MSKSVIIPVAAIIAVAVVAFFFLSTLINNPSAQNTAVSQIPSSEQQAAVITSLSVQDQVVGAGATAQAGNKLTVNYTGKLQNGTVFDSSVGKSPFQFTLGAGRVIQGWDQGLVGMKVGGKRVLVIPSQLAYGEQGAGGGVIPPNAALIFEVELLDVQ